MFRGIGALCAVVLFVLAPALAATPVRIGVDLADGPTLRKAVELAVRDLRADGAQITLTDGGAQALGKAGLHVAVGPAQSTAASAQWSTLLVYGVVAITPSAGAPSGANPPVFHLVASDRQLVDAAFSRISSVYGKNLCVIDDGTRIGRNRAQLMMRHSPNALRVTATQQARNPIVASCITSSDAVFLAGNRLMLFSGPRVANRLSIDRLLDQTFHRDFDITKIGSRYGDVYEPIPAPLVREGRLADVAQAYRTYANADASDDALRAYAATQIAADIATKGDATLEAIGKTTFETVIGRVAFDETGDRLGAPVTIKKL